MLKSSVLQKKYIVSLDILRILSILAVVLIHTTTRKLEFTHYELNYTFLTLFLNQMSRFAVPVFFMISGFALELNYSSINYITYFKKRASRILIPYLFWSVIYFFLVYTVHGMGFLQALLTGNASYQLYFIPSLFVFYLLFPVLHKYYRIIANKWLLIVLLIIEFFLLNYDYRIHSLPFSYPISVAMLNYFPFIIGIIVSHYHKELIKFGKKWKFVLAILAAFFAIYIFNEGKSGYFKTYNLQSFYSQWRPSVLIYSFLVAVTIFYFGRNANLKFIKTLSKLSFFVFFVHVIFLEVVWSTIGAHFVNQTFFDFFFFIIVALLSFGAAYLVHKIPIFTKITG